jgi:hypothetical protein
MNAAERLARQASAASDRNREQLAAAATARRAQGDVTPCPFCGSGCRLCAVRLGFQVLCPACGTLSGVHPTTAAAVKAWAARARYEVR